MPGTNFSLCRTLTSPGFWVFQEPGAGTLLCWINPITMALACYRNTTCMEGLSSGGKENVQLASEPRGCPQKYSLFIAPCPATLSMLVSSFAVLLAPLHSTKKTTIFLISLIGLVCYSAAVFLGEPLQPTENSQAAQEATGAGKPWVFNPAGRHRSVFLD